MARSYAGILGLIAFVTITFRSVMKGADTEGTLVLAGMALVVFTILGWIAGRIAEATVNESVRIEIQAEWEELQAR